MLTDQELKDAYNNSKCGHLAALRAVSNATRERCNETYQWLVDQVIACSKSPDPIYMIENIARQLQPPKSTYASTIDPEGLRALSLHARNLQNTDNLKMFLGSKHDA